jgi:integral membrane protein (TIGR01906 family)
VETLRAGAASVLIGLATALVIVVVALPLFLNPVWVSFEQGRANATAWTGFSEPELHATTDAILADLVLGPPAFDVTVGGAPVLNERERGHMRDVRGVFIGFFAVALVLTAAALVFAARRRGMGRVRTWRAVRGGALALIAVLVVGGVVAVVAFEALFEAFHRLLFPGGSYTFDPATERLVQLFPFAFWQETAIALGAVCIAAAALVTVIAHRRASDIAAAATHEPGEPAGPISESPSPSLPATGRTP